MVICHMTDLFCAMQWHSRRTVKEKKREEIESGEKTERFQRNTVTTHTKTRLSRPKTQLRSPQHH